MVKVGKYNYEKSNRVGKKLQVRVGEKLIHFGNVNYQHFKDKTGIWKSKNHNDIKRRQNYRSRHQGILKKDGKPAYKDPKQPSYHSYNVLW